MDKQSDFDIGFVGAGIVGLSAAYEISKTYPDVTIGLFEKENFVGSHQTGRNSGVIHSGLYYKPGSYKAINCIKGRKLLVKFAQDNAIKHEICGKVIAATNENEIKRMEKLFQNGLDNGIEGIEKINAKQVKNIEPECGAAEGVYVPCTGIIDFKEVAEKLAELVIKQNGRSKIICGCEVKQIDKAHGVTELKTSKGKFRVKFLINCAG